MESLTIIVYLLHFYSHILQVPALPSQSLSLPFSYPFLTFSPNPPQSPQLTPTSLSLSCVPTSCSQILDAAHGCACLRCAPSTEAARSNHCTRPHCTRAHWSWLVLVHKIQIQRQMHNHIDNDKQDKHSTYKSSDPKSMVGGMYKGGVQIIKMEILDGFLYF